VERLVCHACAARDRRASALEETERFGSFLIIKRDDE
jgi:hypothetical protein